MVSLTRKLLAAVLAALGAAGAASAQTYTWTDDGTSTAALAWSAGVWVPGVPPAGGSLTTALRFVRTTTGATASGSRTFTNDIGGMTINSLTVNNSAVQSTAITGGVLTLAQGSNVLTLDGTAPSLQTVGQAGAVISGTGGLALNAATTFSGGGTGYLSVTAPVAGTAGIIVNHAGTSILSLSGTNTFVGDTILNSGYFQVSSASALGVSTNQLVVNGGAVRFGAASTVPNNVLANQTLVVAGGSGALGGTSQGVLSGVVSGVGGVRVQSVATTGGLTLTGANTYTGATTVSPYIPSSPTSAAPTFQVSGAAGSITSTQPLTVGRNATLAVVNATAADLPDRIPDAAPIVFNGGRFQFTGIAGSTETLGAVTLRGAGQITATPTGTSVVNFGALTREDNAGMILSGTNIGPLTSTTANTSVFFGSGVTALAASASTQIPIVPWAAGSTNTNPRNLVTYDATNGLALVPFGNATYFDQVTNSAGLLAAADRNVSLANATYNLGGGTLQVNALTVQTSGATISNGTLQIFSGAYVNYDPVDWNNVTLDFGPRTGYITAGWQQKFTGTSQITGSAGVAVYGQGAGATYTLGFENAGGNPFTGGLFVNGNTTVGFRQDNQLGAAGGTITLGGGLLSYNAAADLSVSRNIKINEANGGFTFGVVGSTAAASTHTPTTVLTLSGVVSGNGAFIKEGTGVVALTGANTYSGGTVLTAGTLRVASDANLGAAAGRLTLNGGTLQTPAATTLARPVDINASSTIQADAALTLSGKVTNVGSLYGNALPVLSKSGAGTLTLTGDTSQLSGNVVVAAGGLTSAGTSGLAQVANITLAAAGATLTLDNTAGLADRVGDNSRVRFTAAGLVSYVPPTTAIAGTAERIGVLESAAAGGVFSVSSAGAVSPVVIRVGSLVANAALTLRGTDLGGTAGNYTRILIDALTTSQAVLPNVFFANTAGGAASTTPAGYDLTRGVILFTPSPVTGASINNFAPDNVPLTAAYTTNANAVASTGASVYSLVLDGGSTLTLNGGNAASGTNANTPDGTLTLSGGLLTSQNGPKSIVVGTAATPVVSFGASQGQVTTASDLTLAAGVTLAGTNGLTKLGSGTLTVNGTYAVTGAVNLAAGSLVLGQSATLGSPTLAAGTTLALNAGGTLGATAVPAGATLTAGGPLTVTDLSGAGTVSVAGNELTVTGAAATTFAGTLTAASLSKTGAGTFTFSPTNTPNLTGTTIGGGTLVLGSAGAGASVLPNYTLNGGVIDVAGQATTAALPTIGGGTANGLTNSSTTTAVTIPASVGADTTLAVAFGGNVVVNKTGAGVLTLTGTGGVTTVTPAPGTINVNEGTLQLNAGGQGIGTGVSVNVAGGATFRLNGASTNNAAHPFGTVRLNGGTWLNNGTSYYDVTLNRVEFGDGGTYSVQATGTPYLIFTGANAGVSTTASSNPAVLGEGATPGSLPPVNLAWNNTATSLPFVIAAGTVPGGVDLDSRLTLAAGTTLSLTKSGPGVLQLSNTGNTWAAVVNAGTLQLNGASTTTATLSGAVTVTGTGVLRGDNALASGVVAVNAGGRVQGGSLANPTGALTLSNTLTVGSQGGLSAVVGAGSASLLSLTGTATVLNLNPGAGSQFVVNLVNNPADPLVGFTEYTVTLASVATAGNIQLNGSSLPDGAIPASNYTVTGVALASTPTLSVSGNNLVLVFTPVPEPATVLAVAGLGLGAVRLVRRRKTVA